MFDFIILIFYTILNTIYHIPNYELASYFKRVFSIYLSYFLYNFINKIPTNITNIEDTNSGKSVVL
jgi:hypothetical protein